MYKYIKRLIDIILGLVVLVFLFPFIVITALLVKIDSKGPVIFKQKRVGQNGHAFTIYKFRTMIVNAETVGTGLDSYANDVRVTRIGKVLRTTSLDEFPQIFNILKGDMSFVGPRPPVTYHPYSYENYPLDAKKRFEVKPGVTGWAQINGRNELSWDEKFVFDLIYLSKMSLLFDIKIFVLTVFKVFRMEGSYDINNKKVKVESDWRKNDKR